MQKLKTTGRRLYEEPSVPPLLAQTATAISVRPGWHDALGLDGDIDKTPCYDQQKKNAPDNSAKD